MRIYFHSLTHPKRAAKALAKYFAKEAADLEMDNHLPLSEAQQVVARMLGYKDWHELAQVSTQKRHPPSPYDEEVAPEVAQQRLEQQIAVLGATFPAAGHAELAKFAFVARPTSGLKAGSIDTRTHNRVIRESDVGFHEPGEAGEWRFLPSLRSDETAEDVYDLLEYDDSLDGRMATVTGCRELLSRVPEHTQASAALISDLYELDDYEEAIEASLHALSYITAAFPPEFPKTGPAPFDWYVLPHRSMLRVYLWAAETMNKTNHPNALQVAEDLVRFDFRDMLEGKALLRKIRQKAKRRQPKEGAA